MGLRAERMKSAADNAGYAQLQPAGCRRRRKESVACRSCRASPSSSERSESYENTITDKQLSCAGRLVALGSLLDDETGTPLIRRISMRQWGSSRTRPLHRYDDINCRSMALLGS